jgi:hypothetical protein
VSRRRAADRLHVPPPASRRPGPGRKQFLTPRDRERVWHLLVFTMRLHSLCIDWQTADEEQIPVLLAVTRLVLKVRIPDTEEELWSTTPLLETKPRLSLI